MFASSSVCVLRKTCTQQTHSEGPGRGQPMTHCVTYRENEITVTALDPSEPSPHSAVSEDKAGVALGDSALVP